MKSLLNILEDFASTGEFKLIEEARYIPLGKRTNYIIHLNNNGSLNCEKIESASASTLNKIINVELSVKINFTDHFVIETQG